MNQLSPQIALSPAEDCAEQVGALCWRMHRGRIEVLLITSRDSNRWVIPKGWPMAGMTPAAAAAMEAWEEAGVEGSMQEAAWGRFSYTKMMPAEAMIACSVSVFGLRVKRLKARFPERAQRQRKWFTLEKAAKSVSEPELRALLRALPTNPQFVSAAALALL